MTDPFATWVRDTQTFLRALDADNTRDWFLTHKDQFDTQLKSPANAFLETLYGKVAKLSGHPRTKLFRQNRDVRFSRDKRPYKTHLHMLWEVTNPQGGSVAWFFGIDLDGARAGGGVLSFPPARLKSWRKALDEDDLADHLDAALTDGFTFRDPDLQRVPAPYGADHPAERWLRHKSLIGWTNIDPATDNLPAAVGAAFDRFAAVQSGLLAVT